MDAMLNVRSMQEEYQKKLYMCFVDMEKAFYRVSRKVMKRIVRKKGLLQIIFPAVMSLYDGTKTSVRVEFAYLEEFEVKFVVHRGSVLSPVLLAIIVNAIT